MWKSTEFVQRSSLDRGSTNSRQFCSSSRHYAETTRALGIVRKAIELIIKGPGVQGVSIENWDVDQEIEKFVQSLLHLAETSKDSLTLARLRAEKRRNRGPFEGNGINVDWGSGGEDGSSSDAARAQGEENKRNSEKSSSSWMVTHGYLAPLADGQLQTESVSEEKMEKMVEERMWKVVGLERQSPDHAECLSIFGQGMNYVFNLLEMEGRQVINAKLEVPESLDKESKMQRVILGISREMIASGYRAVDEIVEDSRRIDKTIISLCKRAYEQGVQSQTSKSPILNLDNVHTEVIKLCGQAEDRSQSEYSIQVADSWDDESVAQLRPWGDLGHYDRAHTDKNGFYLEDPMFLAKVRDMRRRGVRHEDCTVIAHHADKIIKLPFLGWMPIPWQSYRSWSSNTILQDTSGNRRLMYERKDMDLARMQELRELKMRWAVQDKQYLERYKRHVVYNPDWFESGRITNDFSHHPMFVQQPLVQKKQSLEENADRNDTPSDGNSLRAQSGLAQRRGKSVSSLTVDSLTKLLHNTLDPQHGRHNSAQSLADEYVKFIKAAQDHSNRIDSNNCSDWPGEVAGHDSGFHGGTYNNGSIAGHFPDSMNQIDELLGDLELKQQEGLVMAILEGGEAQRSIDSDAPIPDMAFAINHDSESGKSSITTSLPAQNCSHDYSPVSPSVHDFADAPTGPLSPAYPDKPAPPRNTSPFIYLFDRWDKPLPALPPPSQKAAESILGLSCLPDIPVGFSASTVLSTHPHSDLSTIRGSSLILLNNSPKPRPSIECIRMYARATESIYGLERTSQHGKTAAEKPRKIPANFLFARMSGRGSPGLARGGMPVKTTGASLRRIRPLGGVFDSGSVRSGLTKEESVCSRDENGVPTPVGSPPLPEDGELVVKDLRRRASLLKQAKKKVQHSLRASMCGSIQEGIEAVSPARIASSPIGRPDERRVSEVSSHTV